MGMGEIDQVCHRIIVEQCRLSLRKLGNVCERISCDIGDIAKIREIYEVSLT